MANLCIIIFLWLFNRTRPKVINRFKMNGFKIEQSGIKKTKHMITNINIVPVIGIVYGISLGIAIANFPLPLHNISLGTMLYPLASLIILIVCLNKLKIAPRYVGRFKWVLLSFFTFASYLILMSILGHNQIQHMRFLFSLPFLPIITYILTYSFDIGKQLKSSFFFVLLCGGIYTIFVSFYDVRAQGMTAGENSTGVVLTLGFIMALWLQEICRGKLKRWFFGFCSMIFIYGVFVTGSRTSYLMLFICGIMILYHKSRAEKCLMAIKVFFVLVLVSFFVFSQKDIYQFQRVLGAVEILRQGTSKKPGNKNVSRRLQKDKLAIEIAQKHLLLGIGYLNREPLENWYGKNTRFSHNSYLRLLSETGLIGLFLYSCFVFSIFRISSRGLIPILFKRRKTKKHLTGTLFDTHRISNFWLTCGFVGILVSSFFIVMFNEKILWVWLCLIVSEQALHDRGNKGIVANSGILKRIEIG